MNEETDAQSDKDSKKHEAGIDDSKVTVKSSTSSPKKSTTKKVARKKKAVKKVDKDSLKKAAEEKQEEQLAAEALAAQEEKAQQDDNEFDDWDEETDSSGRGPLDLIDGVGSLLGGVRSLSSSALKIAKERTVDSAARMINQSPDQLERMAKAGRSLQDFRSVAGVSIEEVATAIDLKNPDLLKAVEEGKAALPFEILLRLSSFYARNNPIPFILQFARTYNPLISNTLEKIGIDRLVITAEREIQFVQILRSRDAARELSDEDFKRVHAFTEKAFDMALNFAAGSDSEGEEGLEDDDW